MGAAVRRVTKYIAAGKDVWLGIPVYGVVGYAFRPTRRKGMLVCGDTSRDIGCEDKSHYVGCGDTSHYIGCGDTPINEAGEDTPENTKDTPQSPIMGYGVGQNIRYLGWRLTTVLLLSLAFLPTLLAQDLETLDEQKLFAYNGSLSATQTFYHAAGMPSRRDPYFWQLNANLNPSTGLGSALLTRASPFIWVTARSTFLTTRWLATCSLAQAWSTSQKTTR